MTPLTKEQNERFENKKRQHQCAIGSLRDRGLLKCLKCRNEMKSFLASELALARTALIQEIEEMAANHNWFSPKQEKLSILKHLSSLLHRLKEHHE